MPSLENASNVGQPLPTSRDDISKRLVAARRSGRALPDFPGELPSSLSEAYAVQSASISRWSDEVAGWKVGGVPPELRSTLGAPRLAGPIYRSSVFDVAWKRNSSLNLPKRSNRFSEITLTRHSSTLWQPCTLAQRSRAARWLTSTASVPSAWSVISATITACS